MAKHDLTMLLASHPAVPAQLRRGQGMRLSTEPTDETSTTQPHHASAATPRPQRVNRGYRLRIDLILACKRIALEQNRHLYDVMEEALEQYLSGQAGGEES